jgi:hypothetical protein
MYKLALALLSCAAMAACSPTRTGTAAGAATGALVGDPIGAAVGGIGGAAAGAAAGARTAQAPSGSCYVYDRNGRMVVDATGNPRLRRC